jgi:hypothetical protein
MSRGASFPNRMVPLLEKLAAQLLPLRQFTRLHIVAELLDVLSSGAWDRLSSSERREFVTKLERDFHIRAWDEWTWTADEPYSQIHSLIAAEARGLRQYEEKA